MRNVMARWLLALVAAAALLGACDDGDSGGDSDGRNEGEPLRIGYLADRSGSLAELGDVVSVGVELAVQHVNEAGGVNGRDIELFFGDTMVNPTQGVEEARRLVEIEGVQAIVGAISSTVTLAVTESVTGPSGIVMITPSASSPAFSTANDNDFLFRSAPSDVAKGVVLAALAEEEGLDNVGLLYRDDAYGQGSAEVFTNSFSGTVTAASYSALGQTTYLAELQQAASGGAELLVVIAFPGEAEVFLRESIENDIFTNFVFADATRSEDLAAKIGPEHLDGTDRTPFASPPLMRVQRVAEPPSARRKQPERASPGCCAGASCCTRSASPR